jgi:hypothetical protein
MMRILPLVDTSLYGKSVVDYAAWAAATSTATIDMLHVVATNEMLASQMPVHPGGAVILAGELPFDDAMKQRAKEGGILLAKARSTLNSRGIWDANTRSSKEALSTSRSSPQDVRTSSSWANEVSMPISLGSPLAGTWSGS